MVNLLQFLLSYIKINVFLVKHTTKFNLFPQCSLHVYILMKNENAGWILSYVNTGIRIWAKHAHYPETQLWGWMSFKLRTMKVKLNSSHRAFKYVDTQYDQTLKNIFESHIFILVLPHEQC